MSKTITILFMICFLLVSSWLTMSADASPDDIELVFEVVDPASLLVPRDDQSITIDMSGTKVPIRTNLAFRVKRLFPTLQPGRDVGQFVVRFNGHKYRGPNATLQCVINPYPRYTPPPGHYQLQFEISSSQHPKVRPLLAASRGGKAVEKIIFVGAISHALTKVQEETDLAIQNYGKLLQEYNSGTGSDYVMDENDKLVEVIRLDEDGNPAAKTFSPDAIMNVEIYYTSHPKAQVMPTALDLFTHARDTMAFEADLKNGGTGGRQERMIAVTEVETIRTAILNLYYYLSVSANRLDRTFDVLVASPNTRLQSEMQKEWQSSHQAAQELWSHLSTAYLRDAYLKRFDVLLVTGNLSEIDRQKEANGKRFLRGVTEEGFFETISDYITTVNELQLAYSTRLEAGEETANTIAIKRLKRKVAELDQALKTLVRIKGEIPTETDDTKEE